MPANTAAIYVATDDSPARSSWESTSCRRPSRRYCEKRKSRGRKSSTGRCLCRGSLSCHRRRPRWQPHRSVPTSALTPSLPSSSLSSSSNSSSPDTASGSANAAATSTDDDSLNPESVRDRQGLVRAVRRKQNQQSVRGPQQTDAHTSARVAAEQLCVAPAKPDVVGARDHTQDFQRPAFWVCWLPELEDITLRLYLSLQTSFCTPAKCFTGSHAFHRGKLPKS